MSRFRQSRAGIFLGLVLSGAGLVAVTTLVPSGAASSPNARAAPAQQDYVQACPQRTGPSESIGDLNVRLGNDCAAGEKPLKLALWPATGKQGPRGPEGAPGAQGPRGPEGARRPGGRTRAGGRTRPGGPAGAAWHCRER